MSDAAAASRSAPQRFQVVSAWAGELLDSKTFDTTEEARTCADALNKELSIDAIVVTFDPDRPTNWLFPEKS